MKDSPTSPIVSNRMQDHMSRSGVLPKDQSVLEMNRREIATSTHESVGNRAATASQENRPVSPPLDATETAREAWTEITVEDTPTDSNEALQDQVAQLTECNRRQQEDIDWLRERIRTLERGGEGTPATVDSTPRTKRQGLTVQSDTNRRTAHSRSLLRPADDDIPF